MTAGPIEKRNLRTGMHQVADIYCNQCQEIVGWKYVGLIPHRDSPFVHSVLTLFYKQEVAYEESQKYKEGKFIVEKAKLKRASNWA